MRVAFAFGFAVALLTSAVSHSSAGDPQRIEAAATAVDSGLGQATTLATSVKPERTLRLPTLSRRLAEPSSAETEPLPQVATSTVSTASAIEPVSTAPLPETRLASWNEPVSTEASASNRPARLDGNPLRSAPSSGQRPLVNPLRP